MGMGCHRAGHYAGVNASVIHDNWKKMGLIPHNSFQVKLSENTVGLLYAAWELGYNDKEMAEIFGLNEKTVSRYLREAGLPSRREIPEETKSLFIAAWELGYTAQETADIFGCSNVPVRNYLKSFGLKPHRNYPSLSGEKVKKINEAVERGMSIGEGAKYAGVGRSTFLKYRTR